MKNFVKRRHSDIARCSHRQRCLIGGAFDGPLRVLTREKSINQAGGEGITAPNTVENLEVLAICGLIEIAIVVANGSPIIARRGGGFAKCCGDDFEGKVL